MARNPASLPFFVPDNSKAEQVDLIKIKLQFPDGHLHREFYLKIGVLPHWFFSLIMSGTQKYFYEVNEYENKVEIISKIFSNATISDLSQIKQKYNIIKEKTYIVT